MSRIEQAVFTSARTDRGAGYHIVATSPGVRKADRRELAIWGPSHDSLLKTGTNAVSFNFFPLPSGDFCISHTSPVGWEYSGRGGARIYTHCLVVPAETLLQYANHPLALARNAAATGAFDIPTEVPTALETLDLTGTAPAVHQASLTQLLEQVGARQMAMLAQSVLNTACTVAVAGCASAEQLIAGLFDCLPIACRTAISFSTGLRRSSRRPFRVLPLPDDPAARRWLIHQPNVTILDLAVRRPCSDGLVDEWACLVERTLSNTQTSLIADALTELVTGQSAGTTMQRFEDSETATRQGLEYCLAEAAARTGVAASNGNGDPREL
jgi:hypothetical protein